MRPPHLLKFIDLADWNPAMIKSQLFLTVGAWYGLLRHETSAFCVRPVAFAGTGN